MGLRTRVSDGPPEMMRTRSEHWSVWVGESLVEVYKTRLGIWSANHKHTDRRPSVIRGCIWRYLLHWDTRLTRV